MISLFFEFFLILKGGLFPSHMNYLRLYWQEMLEAVFVVHSEDERIVHGDIKPQNFVFVKGITIIGIEMFISQGYRNLCANFFFTSNRSYQID